MQRNEVVATKEQQKHNECIITACYRQHACELQTYILNYTKQIEESEDIVQDIFLKLLESKNIIEEKTLLYLVYTIAHNIVIDFQRHKQVIKTYEHCIKKSKRRHNDVNLSSYSEINELFRKGLVRLTDKQRHIYCMNIEGGMKVSEISKEINEHYKSVEHQLYKARKIMRNYINRMLV